MSNRLEILFNILRVFNLVWIVFCAGIVEMTLNENKMIDTLAQNGNIAYPAQLLPLLIGVLSFARVLWFIYDEWSEKRKHVGAPQASNPDPQDGRNEHMSVP